MIKNRFTNCEEKTQWLLRCDARFGVVSDSQVTCVWASHPALYADFLDLTNVFFSQAPFSADTPVAPNHAATFQRCVGQDHAFLVDISQMSRRLFGWLLVTHVLRVTLYWWKHPNYVKDEAFSQFETLYQTLFDQDDRFLGSERPDMRVTFKRSSNSTFEFLIPTALSSDPPVQHLSITLPNTVDNNCFVVEATRLILIVSS